MTASCKERGYQLVGREQHKDLKKFKIVKIWKRGKKWWGGVGGGGGVRGLWKERESPSVFDFALCGGMY